MPVSPRLLLLSNSRNPGKGFLEHAGDHLRDFLGTGVKDIAFVPYAGVTISWDDYEEMASQRFEELGYRITSVHTAPDPVSLLRGADAIAVAGGNTFHLLKTMAEQGLLEAIRDRVLDGAPYMGWSAGSNVASRTICTTNDMPIVEPPSFAALGLVPFQINPHYTEATLPNHGGETRADRIAEYTTANPGVTVVGLREGTMLRIEGKEVALLGEGDMKVFRGGESPREVAPRDSLAFLME